MTETLPPHVHPDDTAELIAGWADNAEPGFAGDDFCDVLFESHTVPRDVIDEARGMDWGVDSIGTEKGKLNGRFRYDG